MIMQNTIEILRSPNVGFSFSFAYKNMAIGNCGWGDDTKKWFIHFTTTEYKWNLIRNDLKVVRVFKNTDIPKDKIGTVYSTD